MTTTDDLEARLGALEQSLSAMLARVLAVLDRVECRLAGNDNPTLSLEEAGRMLACSERQLYKLARRGHLIMSRAGRRTRVTRASLNEYVANLPRRRRRAQASSPKETER